MKPLSKIAVLDVDGTLLPGALGNELLHELVRADACDSDAAQNVFEIQHAYRQGILDFPSMAASAYEAYGRALAGRSCTRVEAVAREVWAVQRDRLFDFVPELVDYLRQQGYRMMIISGSPAEMVTLVAEELAIEQSHGATFARHGDVYTGGVQRCSGAPGEKARIFADATRGEAVCLSRCFALGDSPTDAALFERVGLPLVFEPGPDLGTLARESGWMVADRADVLACTRSLSSSSTCAPAFAAGGAVAC